MINIYHTLFIIISNNNNNSTRSAATYGTQSDWIISIEPIVFNRFRLIELTRLTLEENFRFSIELMATRRTKKWIQVKERKSKFAIRQTNRTEILHVEEEGYTVEMKLEIMKINFYRFTVSLLRII